MYTDQPALQFYSGNFLKNPDFPFKNGCPQTPQMALCLEAQKMPDSINHGNFTSTVLDEGETYTQTTSYVFSAE
jgi:aldose 1-epimerase